MLTGVVVTNRSLVPTPILKVSAYPDNSVLVLLGSDPIRFYFSVEHPGIWVLDLHGENIRMTKEEAAGFGADFGVWYSS